MRNIRRLGARFIRPINYLDYKISSWERSLFPIRFEGENDPNPLESLYSLIKSDVLILACYVNDEGDAHALRYVLDEATKEFDLIIVVNTGRHILVVEPRFHYIQRPNFGRDLYSYALAVRFLILNQPRRIVLINDSVFWESGALTRFWELAQDSRFEILSMTDSKQGPYHLQSYAFCINQVNNKTLIPFLELVPCHFKRSLVEFGEKSLSQKWKRNGVKLGALWNSESFSENIAKYISVYGEDAADLMKLIELKVPLNPTIHFWPELFVKTGIVKKSLIDLNPARFSNLPKSLGEIKKFLSSQ